MAAQSNDVPITAAQLLNSYIHIYRCSEASCESWRPISTTCPVRVLSLRAAQVAAALLATERRAAASQASKSSPSSFSLFSWSGKPSGPAAVAAASALVPDVCAQLVAAAQAAFSLLARYDAQLASAISVGSRQTASVSCAVHAADVSTDPPVCVECLDAVQECMARALRRVPVPCDTATLDAVRAISPIVRNAASAVVLKESDCGVPLRLRELISELDTAAAGEAAAARVRLLQYIIPTLAHKVEISGIKLARSDALRPAIIAVDAASAASDHGDRVASIADVLAILRERFRLTIPQRSSLSEAQCREVGDGWARATIAALKAEDRPTAIGLCELIAKCHGNLSRIAAAVPDTFIRTLVEAMNCEVDAAARSFYGSACCTLLLHVKNPDVLLFILDNITVEHACPVSVACVQWLAALQCSTLSLEHFMRLLQSAALQAVGELAPEVRSLCLHAITINLLRRTSMHVADPASATLWDRLEACVRALPGDVPAAAVVDCHGLLSMMLPTLRVWSSAHIPALVVDAASTSDALGKLSFGELLGLVGGGLGADEEASIRAVAVWWQRNPGHGPLALRLVAPLMAQPAGAAFLQSFKPPFDQLCRVTRELRAVELVTSMRAMLAVALGSAPFDASSRDVWDVLPPVEQTVAELRRTKGEQTEDGLVLLTNALFLLCTAATRGAANKRFLSAFTSLRDELCKTSGVTSGLVAEKPHVAELCLLVHQLNSGATPPPLQTPVNHLIPNLPGLLRLPGVLSSLLIDTPSALRGEPSLAVAAMSAVQLDAYAHARPAVHRHMLSVVDAGMLEPAVALQLTLARPLGHDAAATALELATRCFHAAGHAELIRIASMDQLVQVGRHALTAYAGVRLASRAAQWCGLIAGCLRESTCDRGRAWRSSLSTSPDVKASFDAVCSDAIRAATACRKELIDACLSVGITPAASVLDVDTFCSVLETRASDPAVAARLLADRSLRLGIQRNTAQFQGADVPAPLLVRLMTALTNSVPELLGGGLINVDCATERARFAVQALCLLPQGTGNDAFRLLQTLISALPYAVRDAIVHEVAAAISALWTRAFYDADCTIAICTAMQSAKTDVACLVAAGQRLSGRHADLSMPAIRVAEFVCQRWTDAVLHATSPVDAVTWQVDDVCQHAAAMASILESHVVLAVAFVACRIAGARPACHQLLRALLAIPDRVAIARPATSVLAHVETAPADTAMLILHVYIAAAASPVAAHDFRDAVIQALRTWTSTHRSMYPSMSRFFERLMLATLHPEHHAAVVGIVLEVVDDPSVENVVAASALRVLVPAQVISAAQLFRPRSADIILDPACMLQSHQQLLDQIAFLQSVFSNGCRCSLANAFARFDFDRNSDDFAALAVIAHAANMRVPPSAHDTALYSNNPSELLAVAASADVYQAIAAKALQRCIRMPLGPILVLAAGGQTAEWHAFLACLSAVADSAQRQRYRYGYPLRLAFDAGVRAQLLRILASIADSHAVAAALQATAAGGGDCRWILSTDTHLSADEKMDVLTILGSQVAHSCTPPGAVRWARRFCVKECLSEAETVVQQAATLLVALPCLGADGSAPAADAWETDALLACLRRHDARRHPHGLWHDLCAAASKLAVAVPFTSVDVMHASWPELDAMLRVDGHHARMRYKHEVVEAALRRIHHAVSSHDPGVTLSLDAVLPWLLPARDRWDWQKTASALTDVLYMTLASTEASEQVHARCTNRASVQVVTVSGLRMAAEPQVIERLLQKLCEDDAGLVPHATQHVLELLLLCDPWMLVAVARRFPRAIDSIVGLLKPPHSKLAVLVVQRVLLLPGVRQVLEHAGLRAALTAQRSDASCASLAEIAEIPLTREQAVQCVARGSPDVFLLTDLLQEAARRNDAQLIRLVVAKLRSTWDRNASAWANADGVYCDAALAVMEQLAVCFARRHNAPAEQLQLIPLLAECAAHIMGDFLQARAVYDYKNASNQPVYRELTLRLLQSAGSRAETARLDFGLEALQLFAAMSAATPHDSRDKFLYSKEGSQIVSQCFRCMDAVMTRGDKTASVSAAAAMRQLIEYLGRKLPLDARRDCVRRNPEWAAALMAAMRRVHGCEGADAGVKNAVEGMCESFGVRLALDAEDAETPLLNEFLDRHIGSDPLQGHVTVRAATAVLNRLERADDETMALLPRVLNCLERWLGDIVLPVHEGRSAGEELCIRVLEVLAQVFLPTESAPAASRVLTAIAYLIPRVDMLPPATRSRMLCHVLPYVYDFVEICTLPADAASALFQLVLKECVCLASEPSTDAQQACCEAADVLTLLATKFAGCLRVRKDARGALVALLARDALPGYGTIADVAQTIFGVEELPVSRAGASNVTWDDVPRYLKCEDERILDALCERIAGMLTTGAHAGDDGLGQLLQMTWDAVNAGCPLPALRAVHRLFCNASTAVKHSCSSHTASEAVQALQGLLQGRSPHGERFRLLLYIVCNALPRCESCCRRALADSPLSESDLESLALRIRESQWPFLIEASSRLVQSQRDSLLLSPVPAAIAFVAKVRPDPAAQRAVESACATMHILSPRASDAEACVLLSRPLLPDVMSAIGWCQQPAVLARVCRQIPEGADPKAHAPHTARLLLARLQLEAESPTWQFLHPLLQLARLVDDTSVRVTAMTAIRSVAAQLPDAECALPLLQHVHALLPLGTGSVLESARTFILTLAQLFVHLNELPTQAWASAELATMVFNIVTALHAAGDCGVALPKGSREAAEFTHARTQILSVVSCISTLQLPGMLTALAVLGVHFTGDDVSEIDIVKHNRGDVQLRRVLTTFVPEHHLNVATREGGGGFSHILRGTLRRGGVDTPVIIKTGRTARDVQRLLQEASIMHDAQAMRGPWPASCLRLLGLTLVRGNLGLILRQMDGDVARVLMPGDDAVADLTFDEKMHVAREMVRALDHCHSNGILHGDLKLENFLRSAGGGRRVHECVLADFGSAVRVEATGDTPADTERLQREIRSGTPQYWAPEICQAIGARREWAATRASDLWALGCTLAALARSNHPFHGDLDATKLTLLNTMGDPAKRDTDRPAYERAVTEWAALLTAASPLRPRLPPGCPPALAEVIRLLLATNPADRPSASEVLRRLA